MDFSSIDLKNFELLEKYIKIHGFEKQDEDFALSALRNPFIDDSYKNLVGEGLRMRWPILGKSTEANDSGWQLFKSYFKHYPLMSIGHQEYKDNKMTVGKNTVKIKKVMADYYIQNFSYFLTDFSASLGIPRDYDGSNIISKKNKDLINAYIVKAFEVIGTKKIPNSELQLVLSFNFADWFLCSTAETWSSCLSLDNGAYWVGLTSLLGDKNRAFLYITNGSKKNWHGIEVDSCISRTWVLLTKKNEKKVVRFYPSEFLSISDIQKATGDYTFTSSINEKISKNEIYPIKYKKGGIWSTIFNDACGIDRDFFKETGKLIWTFGRTRTGDCVSIPQKLTSGEIEMGIKRTLHTPHDYLSRGKFINDDVFANVCSHCGKVLGGDAINVGEDKYCQGCAKELLVKCEKCRSWELKEEIAIYTVSGKVMRICSRCVKKTFLCINCGERHFEDGSARQLQNEKRKVCSKCIPFVVKCEECEEEFLKKELLHHKDMVICGTCFSKRKYHEWRACSSCLTTHLKQDMIYSINGDGACNKCTSKLAHNDKRQLRFIAISY